MRQVHQRDLCVALGKWDIHRFTKFTYLLIIFDCAMSYQRLNRQQVVSGGQIFRFMDYGASLFETATDSPARDQSS
jgi:hypothetical protein